MTTLEKTIPVAQTSMSETSEHHAELAKKYSNTKPNSIELESYTAALMPFNGYYGLDITGVEGAFITVDTNMHMQKGATVPIYDISLIISLDGVTSHRIPFTGTKGTFTNNKLFLETPATASGSTLIDLTFTRSGSTTGPTVSITGSIVLLEEEAKNVTGSTYNNPIHYEQYIGSYHAKFLGISESYTVLEIKDDYTLMFDYNNPSATKLTKVPSYTYSLNMYFFSFDNETNMNNLHVNNLIMGTSSKGGLICNDMMSLKGTNKVKSTRLLQTIETSKVIPTTNPNNTNSEALGEFSGYYPLPSVDKGAFISIEGIYTYSSSPTTCQVMVGVSLDGKKSEEFTFDSSMAFSKNNTLTISELVDLKFTREYTPDGSFGSLVTISGKVNGKTVKSYTAFNPVPLIGFGEAPMINSAKDSLTAESASIIWNGTTVTDFEYIPIMYILAWKDKSAEGSMPMPKDEMVLSFGTDGKSGNTCICTEYLDKIPFNISVVCAIPAAKG